MSGSAEAGYRDGSSRRLRSGGLATALLQVLVRTTPRALSFFQCLMLLLVVIAVNLKLRSRRCHAAGVRVVNELC